MRSEPAPAAAAPATLDPLDPADRQPLATPVSRLTWQRGAEAVVEVPEIGRVVVTARARRALVDVSVVAPAHGAALIREAHPELEAYLREASVPLGSLRVGVGGEARSGAFDQRPSREHHARDDRGAPDPDREIAAPRPVRGRARFVL